MTAIYFYSGAADKLQVACRLCAKALSQGAKVFVYSPDSAVLEKLDKLLWSFQPTSFLPHCFFNDDVKLVNSTPIILGNHIPPEQGYEMLVNLHEQCPTTIDRFRRVIEIAGLSPEDKSSARERYRFYKKAGYELHHYKLGSVSNE